MLVSNSTTMEEFNYHLPLYEGFLVGHYHFWGITSHIRLEGFDNHTPVAEKTTSTNQRSQHVSVRLGIDQPLMSFWWHQTKTFRKKKPSLFSNHSAAPNSPEGRPFKCSALIVSNLFWLTSNTCRGQIWRSKPEKHLKGETLIRTSNPSNLSLDTTLSSGQFCFKFLTWIFRPFWGPNSLSIHCLFGLATRLEKVPTN